MGLVVVVWRCPYWCPYWGLYWCKWSRAPRMTSCTNFGSWHISALVLHSQDISCGIWYTTPYTPYLGPCGDPSEGGYMEGCSQHYTCIHTTTHALAWSATHYQYTTWVVPTQYLTRRDPKWVPKRGVYGVLEVPNRGSNGVTPNGRSYVRARVSIDTGT